MVNTTESIMEIMRAMTSRSAFIAWILFLPESTEGVAVGATTAMNYENAADSTENDAETVVKIGQIE